MVTSNFDRTRQTILDMATSNFTYHGQRRAYTMHEDNRRMVILDQLRLTFLAVFLLLLLDRNKRYTWNWPVLLLLVPPGGCRGFPPQKEKTNRSKNTVIATS